VSKRRMSWLAVVVLTAVLIAAAAYWSPHAPPHAVPPRVDKVRIVHAHPEVVVSMVRALFEAERFMRSDPEAALAIVSRRVGAEEEGLGPIWKKFDFSVGMSQSSLSTIEDVARWAMARQYVTARPMPNFLSNLYLAALLAVRPERVTVIR